MKSFWHLKMSGNAPPVLGLSLVKSQKFNFRWLAIFLLLAQVQVRQGQAQSKFLDVFLVKLTHSSFNY